MAERSVNTQKLKVIHIRCPDVHAFYNTTITVEVNEKKRRKIHFILLTSIKRFHAIFMAFGLFPVEAKKSWIRMTCVNLLRTNHSESANRRFGIIFLSKLLPLDINPFDTRHVCDLSRWIPQYADHLIIIRWSHKCALDEIYQISSMFWKDYFLQVQNYNFFFFKFFPLFKDHIHNDDGLKLLFYFYSTRFSCSMINGAPL